MTNSRQSLILFYQDLLATSERRGDLRTAGVCRERLAQLQVDSSEKGGKKAGSTSDMNPADSVFGKQAEVRNQKSEAGDQKSNRTRQPAPERRT